MAQGKEVAQKQKNEVAAYRPDANLMDMAPEADISDIKFAKIKIHQGTTTGRKGMVGDIYETSTMATLVGPEEKLNFIPITFYKRWFHNIQKPGDTKPSAQGQSNFKTDDEFPWKVTEADGTIKRNIRTICFFAMLEKDLDDPAALPVLIMLYSTNYTAAGQPLVTRYSALKKGGIEPWLSLFKLSTEQSKKGPHQIYKVEPVADKNGQKMVDEKYFPTMRKWAEVILKMQTQGLLQLKVADVDTEDAEENTPDVTAPRDVSKTQIVEEKDLPF